MDKNSKWKLPSQRKAKNKYGSKKSGKYEQAATLQNSGDDSIPTFVKNYDKNNSKGKKDRKAKQFKPIMIATISAIVIGGLLGFTMLKMFGGFNDDIQAGGDGNLTPAVADAEDNKSEDKPVESSAYTLDPVSAFVLQGGVFSEKSNAEVWADDYEEAGLSSVIWEAESQFYLFAGIAGSKDEAKQAAENLQGYGFDIFVKEWSTGETEVELTETEHSWLVSFQNLWQETMNSLNNAESFSIEQWKTLNADYPEESEKLSGLSSMIKELSGEIETADSGKYQYFLLNLWLKYDEVLNK